MKYIKTYNESIKHFLKPKSEEDILKISKNMSNHDKLIKGAKYGLLQFVKDALKPSSKFILYLDKILDEEIQNALNIACFYGNLEIVKYLIDNKIVNLKENEGKCFLKACENGQFEVIKYFLKQGDIIYDISTRNWKTSIFLLKEYGYKHILDYINKFDMFPKIDEGIRHLLKPKSEETILKSLENEHIEDKYRILLLYQLYDLAEKIGKEIRNYFFVYSSDYYALVCKRTPIRFNDEEVDLIVKQIKVDTNNLNYAKFNHVAGSDNWLNLEDPTKTKFTSLYIRDGSYTYEINNYKYFITVKHYNQIRNIKDYYICKSMKELLKFLDDYMIMVKIID